CSRRSRPGFQGVLMSEFKVEPYCFDANQEVVALLDSVFKPWTGDEDYFAWKFQSYKLDLTTFPLVWIVRDKDKIISFNGFGHRRVKIGSSFHYAVQSFDGATSPLYKGKGLFSKINKIIYDEMARHNIAWVYGWGTPVMFKILTTKHNWQIWDAQCYLTKILNKDVYLKSKFGNPLLRGVMKVPLDIMSRRRGVRINPQIRVERLGDTGFSDDVSGLMSQVYDGFDIIGERDKEWLNWCLANPIREYASYSAYLDNNMVGYVVVMCNKEQNTYEIADCIGRNEDALFAMLDHLEKLALEEKKDRISYRINQNHPYIAHFKKFGYLRSKGEVPMASKVVNDEQAISKIIMHKDKNLHWCSFDRLE
ncbi:MAG: hypothetical protein ABIA59_10235, partial [Candidatus Latescibacterota bacterium]